MHVVTFDIASVTGMEAEVEVQKKQIQKRQMGRALSLKE
jgi:hypothetical protein